MAVSYCYFLLAILDLGILLGLEHGQGICIVDAFIIIIIIIIIIITIIIRLMCSCILRNFLQYVHVIISVL